MASVNLLAQSIFQKLGISYPLKNSEEQDETILDKLIVSPDRQHAIATWLANNYMQAEYVAKLSPHLFNELEFFQSNDPEQQPYSYFDCLNKTRTTTGTAILRKILEQPLTTSRDLLFRQQCIQYFAQNVNNNLTKSQEPSIIDENGCMWFINQLVHNGRHRTDELDELMTRLFFNHRWCKWLNNEDRILNSYFLWKIWGQPLWVLLRPIAVLMVVWYVMLVMMRRFNAALTLKDIRPMFWKYIKQSFLGSQFFTLMGMLKKYLASPDCWGKPDANLITKIKLWATTGILTVLCSPLGTQGYLGLIVYSFVATVYQSVKSSLDYLHTFNFLNAKIAGVRNMAIRCRDFHTNHGPALQQNHEYLKLASGLEHALNSNTLRFLLQSTAGCNPGTIQKGKRCLKPCWNPGQIMRAFWLLAKFDKDSNTESLDSLGALVAYQGWLDCYISTSRMVTAGGMSTAQFIWDPNTSKIDIKGVYHPICPPASMVPNDICLSNIPADKEHMNNEELNNTVDTSTNNTENTTDTKKADEQGMILSGPNGSGKSTYLKSVMSAVICAQTLGYAPSTTCVLTPFKYLSTYLNIPDCQGRESLFQAEMNRCYNHLETLKQLDASKLPSFNIMDEIFSSTNYQEGASGAYAVLRRLGKLKHAINIITTHYDQLTQLDDNEKPEGFLYKHFTAQLDALSESENDNITGGRWRCDYKLRDGVNKKHLALQLLQQRGFDNELMQDAVDMYERICGHPNRVIEEELRDLGIVVDVEEDICNNTTELTEPEK